MSQPQTTDMDRAWWRCRAQIAAALWGAMADGDMTVGELAERSTMKPRRLRAILRAEALSVSTTEIAVLAFALGRRWSVSLEPSPAICQESGT
jgi:hypothetical protein